MWGRVKVGSVSNQVAVAARCWSVPTTLSGGIRPPSSSLVGMGLCAEGAPARLAPGVGCARRLQAHSGLFSNSLAPHSDPTLERTRPHSQHGEGEALEQHLLPVVGLGDVLCRHQHLAALGAWGGAGVAQAWVVCCRRTEATWLVFLRGNTWEVSARVECQGSC